MFLCLMRHGKAEPFQQDGDDSCRRLTKAGKQRVKMAASLAGQWWPSGRTVIWSSPLVRAQETAAIMKKSIHAVHVDTHESIAAGDLDVFYADVLRSETADVILVIGHEPFFGQWTERLTGTPIDFKTGGIALFDYDPTAEPVGQAELLLYVQPKMAHLILGNKP